MNTAIYIQLKLCPESAPGAGHSALTQQNVHGYRGSTVTVHNIPSGIGKAITVWLGTYISVVNKIYSYCNCTSVIIKIMNCVSIERLTTHLISGNTVSFRGSSV